MALNSRYARRIRARLVAQQEGRCCYCGRPFTEAGPGRPTIEHRKAKMDGGTDRAANLAAACQHCNQLRGRQMVRDRLKAARAKREGPGVGAEAAAARNRPEVRDGS